MFWFVLQREIVRNRFIKIGEWCMPWWRRVAKPDDMSRPDLRTEKVIGRLELVAERMEAVAKVLSDDLDAHDDEQRDLQRIVREAQDRPRRSLRPDRGNDDEGRASNGGSID